jgi:hypothetical protein
VSLYIGKIPLPRGNIDHVIWGEKYDRGERKGAETKKSGNKSLKGQNDEKRAKKAKNCMRSKIWHIAGEEKNNPGGGLLHHHKENKEICALCITYSDLVTFYYQNPIHSLFFIGSRIVSW